MHCLNRSKGEALQACLSIISGARASASHRRCMFESQLNI